MKNTLILFLSIVSSLMVFGQVGIGTSTPHASAQLELNATNRGFLPTRIALTSLNDLTTVSSPAPGLLVYNTATAGASPNNVTPGYYYFNGSKWVRISGVTKIDDLSDASYDSVRSNMGIGMGTLASLSSDPESWETKDNIAIGTLALNKNTGGANNLAIGYRTLRNNTTGSGNIAIGNGVLSFSTIGIYNTAIGHFSGNYGGFGNTTIGYGSMGSSGGDFNTAVGVAALYNEVGSGEKNTIIGAMATIHDKAGPNIKNSSAIGYRALIWASNTIQLGNDSIVQVLTSGKVRALGYLTTGTTLTSATDVTTIPTPDTGLVVYNKSTAGTSPDNVTPGYYYFTGSRWASLTGASNLDALSDASYDSVNVNMGIGVRTLSSVTPDALRGKGIENIAIGNWALNRNTTGSNNIAIGSGSMPGISTGSYNIAIGKNTQYTNETGCFNTTVGHYAGADQGIRNTSVGYGALGGWGGYDNTAIGYETLRRGMSPGLKNTFIGSEAYIPDDVRLTVKNSSAIGYRAIVRASNTIQLGNDSIVQVLTSGKVRALGYLTTGTALTSATDVITIPSPDTGLVVYNKATAGTSPDNVTPGYYYFKGNKWVRLSGVSRLDELEDARYDSTNGNMSIGSRALESNTSGQDNLAIGIFSLKANMNGKSNLAVGNNTLYNNTSGSNNLAIGKGSLFENTAGSMNIALGPGSLYANNTGSNNIALGNSALQSNRSGIGNIGIGTESLLFNDGNDNVAVGGSAMAWNTTGSDNTAIGTHSLSNNGGSYNVAVGKDALLYNHTGSYNTAIGYQATVSIGNLTNATAIGYGAYVSASNTIRLGNHVVTDVLTTGNITANGILLTSDARLKTNIEGIEGGLETLLRLRPYSYQKRSGFEPGYHEDKEYGFLAQDIREILPELVKEGNDPDKVLTVNYTALIPILTKAIQEQQEAIRTQQKEIDELKVLLKTRNGNKRQKSR